MTRVYTRTGDEGTTALVGGKRVPQDSPRIAAYGAVDELKAIVDLARVFNEERLQAGEGHQWLDDVLQRLQNELFDLGSELATPKDAVYEAMFRFSEHEVKALERLIDQCQKALESLTSFVPPGGGRISGFLRQGRTVCRRAERHILTLSHQETIHPSTLKYINRLSDFLFVLLRWVDKRLGESESLWERGLQTRPRRKRGSVGHLSPSMDVIRVDSLV